MVQSIRRSPSGPLQEIESGGAAFPFTNGVYLDQNTIVPLADRNGSAVSPFKEFADALINTVDGLLIASYTLAEAFNLDRNLWIQSVVQQSPRSGFPTVTPVNLGDLTITGGIGTGFIGLWGCSIGLVDGTLHSYDLYLRGGSQVLGNITSLNTLNSDEGLVAGTVDAGGIVANRTTFFGAITIVGSELTITSSTFGAGFIITVAGTLFIDVSSLASLRTSGTTLAAGGGLSVIDGPAIQYQFGALDSTDGEFLTPDSKTEPTTETITNNWSSVSVRRFAHSISANLSAVHTADVICTLFTGTTIAGLAATALEVTIPIGQLTATFDLITETVDMPAGSYMAVQFTSNDDIVASAMECLVGVS